MSNTTSSFNFIETKIFSQEEFSKIKKNDFIDMMETEYRFFEIYLLNKYRIDLYKNEKGWAIALFEKSPRQWIDDPGQLPWPKGQGL